MAVNLSTRQKLREQIETLPVIDCHEHTCGAYGYHKYTEPITTLTRGYIMTDFEAAACGEDVSILQDDDVSTEKKWPTFEKLWKRLEHTAYAQMTKRILADEYGVREITLQALQGIADRLLDFTDPDVYAAYLDKHLIKCRLVDLIMFNDLRKEILAGRYTLPPYDRLMISLPECHDVSSFDDIRGVASQSGREATSLEEYLDVCRQRFEKLKSFGAAGFKDQSAYRRSIDFANPSRKEAEQLFNCMREDESCSMDRPQRKPLNDYLFHCFMQMAAEMDMPVQIHTGYLNNSREDVRQANAALLTPVLREHQDVRFDLFHGNWPYAGEWLYLAKNFPNVSLDCCWLHIIDPRYARRVLADAIMTVPHNKIHGFGGDDFDNIEYAVAHLSIARDNIAAALAEVVDDGWMDFDQAVQVAADWLFNNPNEFFKLGFEPVSV